MRRKHQREQEALPKINIQGRGETETRAGLSPPSLFGVFVLLREWKAQRGKQMIAQL